VGEKETRAIDQIELLIVACGFASTVEDLEVDGLLAPRSARLPPGDVELGVRPYRLRPRIRLAPNRARANSHVAPAHIPGRGSATDAATPTRSSSTLVVGHIHPGQHPQTLPARRTTHESRSA